MSGRVASAAIRINWGTGPAGAGSPIQASTAPTQVGSEETSAVAEIVSDPSDTSPDQAMMDASNAPIVQALLRQLEPRQRKILELRFALDGYQGPPRTFKQIGKVVGLTRERVRQLEKKALAELKGLAENWV